jgi:glycerophosphoryl diester phosphodiesterase
MTLVLAHRGSVDASRRVRENTLEAFALAADLGADGVELDVRRTADGHLVVHHAETVAAGDEEPGHEAHKSNGHAGEPIPDQPPSADTGEPGIRIATSPRADLPPWVPGLRDALDVCLAARLIVNVEIKSEPDGPSADPQQLCARDATRVCTEARAPRRIVLSSFSIPALKVARQVNRNAQLAWLYEPRSAPRRAFLPDSGPQPKASGASRGRGAESDLLSWAEIEAGLEGRGWLSALGPLNLEGLHPYYRLVDEALIAAAHSRGLAVRVWTVDRPAVIRAAAASRADAIITNDVAAARSCLASS